MNNLNYRLRKELKYITLFLILMSICFYLFNNWYKKQSDTIYVYAEEPTETPVSSPKPQQEPSDIKGYIEYIFGEDAPKAFKLLQGEGVGTCAENRNLDQKAYNRNWIEGKPGEYWSTDWGIFQINDKFHPVEKLNLRTDWKANIRYAKRMFDNDGGSFKRWTCGRYYNI